MEKQKQWCWKMNKNALIIGGTGGIGSAISYLFVKNGIKVYATYYRDKEEKTQALLDKCEVMECDIREKGDVKSIISHILNNDSKLDIVINLATSKLKLKPFEQLAHEDFFEDIDVIVMGAVNLYKQVVPIMKKNKSGIIINFLTATVINPPARMSSYVTAKSGLLGLTKSLGAELNPFNIRVLGVSPSFVETDLIKGFPPKLLEIEREKQPDKKFIQPEDIAEITNEIIDKPEKYPSGTNILLQTRQDIVRIITGEAPYS